MSELRVADFEPEYATGVRMGVRLGCEGNWVGSVSAASSVCAN